MPDSCIGKVQALSRVPKSKTNAPARDRAYYDALSDEDLYDHWAKRAKLGIQAGEEALLRTLVRERKGFKPVEPFVSVCQRCNLPADNCACHR